jgi:hypothetical protein
VAVTTTPTPASQAGERVHTLLEGSVEALLASWDPLRALFPFTSWLHDGRVIYDYEDPVAVRYTANSLLGLVEAARSRDLGVELDDVEAMTRTFLRPGRIRSPADVGLIALLRARLGEPARALSAPLRDVRDALAQHPRELNMQDLAWLLWGGAEIRRAGVGIATDVVELAHRQIAGRLHPATGLPRHSLRRLGRDVVSFGSLTYYLRAMHEAALTLRDPVADVAFMAGVERAMSLQGELGEWPWMISARTGAAFDRYPVFAVHQDAMAMLFLHPAQDAGMAGAGAAIARSLGWDFGANELRCEMFERRPFFAYRAIERAERMPRARRYLRSLRPPATTGAARVRINRECRSYHLGWILFAWARRR